MIDVELGATASDLALALLSTAAIYLAIVAFTKVVGLRSFSKMSSFDFAMTVAIGSTMASVGMGNSSLAVGVVVLASLYLVQFTIARSRVRWERAEGAVDNSPMLLMAGRTFLEDNMRRARVTRADVLAKLREANVLDLDQVRAVVLETTGDISVLHAGPDGPELDHALLCEDVVGAERLGEG